MQATHLIKRLQDNANGKLRDKSGDAIEMSNGQACGNPAKQGVADSAGDCITGDSPGRQGRDDDGRVNPWYRGHN